MLLCVAEDDYLSMESWEAETFSSFVFGVIVYEQSDVQTNDA